MCLHVDGYVTEKQNREQHFVSQPQLLFKPEINPFDDVPNDRGPCSFSPGEAGLRLPRESSTRSARIFRVADHMRDHQRHFVFKLALLGFCGLAVCPASAEDGIVSLFNGKDLSG